MRSHLAHTLAFALAVAVLAGCGKNNLTPPGGSASNDQSAASAAVAREPGVVDDGLSDSPDQTSLNAPAGAAALINPLTYWRTITNVDRTFEFAFSDTDSTGKPTTAIVTIRKTLTGRFNILAGVPGTDGTPIDSTVKIVHKPLEDHWVRRILLKRVQGGGRGRGRSGPHLARRRDLGRAGHVPERHGAHREPARPGRHDGHHDHRSAGVLPDPPPAPVHARRGRHADRDDR
jgi:hypothetical protein